MDFISEFLAGLSVMALPILLAITLHEAAHGYVANMLGDATAKNAGRLTLNPIAHIDFFGTIILPILVFFTTSFIFGYAKPVPVNFRNLRNPKRDMIWVALAGPGANIFLALAGGFLAMTAGLVPVFMQGWLLQNLHLLIFFNLILAILNMMPLLPLDGGRVLAGLLPDDLSRRFHRMEPFGILIFIAFFFLSPMLFGLFGLNFNPAEVLIFRPAISLYAMITGAMGLDSGLDL